MGSTVPYLDAHTFATIAKEAWDAVPEPHKSRIQNVALLIEEEPSEALRKEEHLAPHDTLLGYYHGIPQSARGSEYGVEGTMPDTITLFRLPILSAAEELTDTDTSNFRKNVVHVVEETIWHELGHYFGLDEAPINEREVEGTNTFNH